MAPIAEGFWGKPTSTLDWCELNYEVSYYIAEFWNTVSNLFLLLPPLYGGWLSWKHGLELRYLLSYASLFIVGVGSWCFHMTLLYEMQLLDELPMLWGCLTMLYGLFEVHSPPDKLNFALLAKLTIYGTVVSIVYVAIRQPIFHQVAYALLVFLTVFADIRLAGTRECEVWVFFAAATSYFVAFCLWNVDNIFCSELTLTRQYLPFFLRPLTQLHGWWHCLAGYGTYMQVLYFCHARMLYRKEPCEIRIFWPLMFAFLGPKKQKI